MATKHANRIAITKGPPSLKAAWLHTDPRDIICAYLGSNDASQDLFQDCFPTISGSSPYNSAAWTTTATGTGAAIAVASTAGGGVLLTCGSTSTFNTNLQSVQGFTPTTGYRYGAAFRLQCSSTSAVGWSVGFGNSQVDPLTTDYTDGVYFQKAVATATVTGRVRGDSGTAAATSTLVTVSANTEIMLGFDFLLDANNPAGRWWTFDTTNGLVETPFTANQLTQAAAILTTPPTCYFNLNAKGSSGNPTVTVATALAWSDNAY